MKQKRSFLKIIGLVSLFSSLSFFCQEMAVSAAEPIKIGAVLSISGRGGFLGTPEKEGITIVTEEVNGRGGILGRPLEIFFEDDQSNPTNSAVAATKLIRDKKVCSIIGSSLVVGCMAMIPICEREEVPQILPTPVTDPLKKWIFKPILTDYRVSLILLKFTVETLGARKIALFHSTDSHGAGGAQAILDNIEKMGASVVITEKCDPADTNMIPQLTKIKTARPDAIILYANAVPASVVAKNYQQLGIEIPVVTSHGVPGPDFLRIAGKTLEGRPWYFISTKSIVAEQFPPDDPWRAKVYDPFKKALKEKYPKSEYSTFHANGHDTTRILIEGLKIARTDDRVALRDALEKVRYTGLNADFKFSPTDHDGSVGEFYRPFVIKDGKFQLYK
ncbi:MAG: ABC transporter substrate-binding protein [Flavisolibacter sp.]